MVKQPSNSLHSDPAAARSPKPRLIWQRMLTDRGSRKLDYPAIARAAMKLADDGRMNDVSMRTLAVGLGVGTMSLYRYVADKDDLLDLMLDQAFGEISIPAKTSNNWRKDLTRVFAATRRIMLTHPWLAILVTSRPAIGPNYLSWFEFLLAATALPNRKVAEHVRIIGTVWAFVSGFVAYEIGERDTNRRHQLTEESKRAIAAPYMEQVLATGKLPHLGKFFANTATHASSDQDFEFGLQVVLDGLALKFDR